jgi:acylphosphatase
MKNIQIAIAGKVHKTGLEYFLKQMAEQYSINGYVRYNPADCHKLIIEAEGKTENLDEFIKYCRIGTWSSEIKNINIADCEIKNHSSFEIIE